jgi:hypothetical protein
MAAPEISVILPEIVPPTTCPCRRLEQKTPSSNTRTVGEKTTDLEELIADGNGHLLKVCQLDIGLNCFP